MSKVYVPELQNNNCVIISNNNTLRVYDNRPTQNSNVHYIDYYFNSHYMSVEGTQNFNQYSSIPVCINNDNLTTEVFYRNDIMDILVTFTILCIFIILIPLRILLRMFKRFRL